MRRGVRETDAISWAPKALIASELRDGSFVALPFAPPLGKEMFLVELRAVGKKHSGAPPRKRGARKGGLSPT